MRDPERYKGLFVFVFTFVVMTIIGAFLFWVRETGRWEWFAVYCVVLAFIIGRTWNYRPDW